MKLFKEHANELEKDYFDIISEDKDFKIYYVGVKEYDGGIFGIILRYGRSQLSLCKNLMSLEVAELIVDEFKNSKYYKESVI